MFTKDLTTVLAYKGATCISIVTPLESRSASGKTNRQILEQTLDQASGFLVQMCRPEESAVLMTGLKELVNALAEDMDPTTLGAGLYVSAQFKRLLKFPFPVQHRIVIADSFALREALYLHQYDVDYVLLCINGKTARCYNGNMSALQEIVSDRFPVEYHDDYEYNKPSRSTSYAGSAGVKSFEKDKSVLNAERMQQFFRGVDKALTDSLGGLLVVAGPEKDIALFADVSRHRKNIIARVSGNYDRVNVKELHQKAWPLVRSWAGERDHMAVTELLTRQGSGLAVEGIRNVWHDACAGKGLKLLVEKDFSCSGFTDKEGRLHLKAPSKPHQILMDVPEEIMRVVIEKNGEVVFLNNNDLADHQHIALINRY
jgi:hypothetical protein